MTGLKTFKICSGCKKYIDLDLFYNDKSKKDGKKVNCKMCSSKSYKSNKEKEQFYINVGNKIDVGDYNEYYNHYIKLGSYYKSCMLTLSLKNRCLINDELKRLRKLLKIK